jgi:hypothetical protein
MDHPLPIQPAAPVQPGQSIYQSLCQDDIAALLLPQQLQRYQEFFRTQGLAFPLPKIIQEVLLLVRHHWAQGGAVLPEDPTQVPQCLHALCAYLVLDRMPMHFPGFELSADQQDLCRWARRYVLYPHEKGSSAAPSTGSAGGMVYQARRPGLTRHDLGGL